MTTGCVMGQICIAVYGQCLTHTQATTYLLRYVEYLHCMSDA